MNPDTTGVCFIHEPCYTDDIVMIFSERAKDLQEGLDVLYEYCDRWKLVVNTSQTIVMVFERVAVYEMILVLLIASSMLK